MSFEWSDITEFSNKSSETSGSSVMSSTIKNSATPYWICRVLLLLLQSISRRGPDSFCWTLHQKIFWRCTEESNKTRPWLFTLFFGAKLCHTPEGSLEMLARGRAHWHLPNVYLYCLVIFTIYFWKVSLQTTSEIVFLSKDEIGVISLRLPKKYFALYLQSKYRSSISPF